MRHFYIKTQGVVPERSILLICLVPGDWRKLMFEGLDNIAGPGQAVDHTCIRFCPSDAEADRFIAHIDAGGSVDDFPGREVSAEIVRAAAAEDRPHDKYAGQPGHAAAGWHPDDDGHG